MDARLPVTILTGFLGSGKTTLLNRLLQHPQMQDTAVIVNEVGEIPLDHLLVESAIEDTIVLQSGCICCSIRGDLVDTLRDLEAKRSRGEIPPFSRIAVETTGLADPAPILRTLAVDPLLTPLFKLHRIVTTVDAAIGLEQLARQPEAAKQAALADLLIITKTDLAPASTLAELRARLAAVNPLAPQREIIMGAIEPEDVFGGSGAEAGDFIGRLAANMFPARGDDLLQARHGTDIRAVSMIFDKPFTEAGLRRWLAALVSLRSADVLRIKGLFDIEGEARPVVVHVVQHLIHPFGRLDDWPDRERRSRVVCITRNIPDEALRHSLEVLLQEGTRSPA